MFGSTGPVRELYTRPQNTPYMCGAFWTYLKSGATKATDAGSTATGLQLILYFRCRANRYISRVSNGNSCTSHYTHTRITILRDHSLVSLVKRLPGLPINLPIASTQWESRYVMSVA